MKHLLPNVKRLKEKTFFFLYESYPIKRVRKRYVQKLIRNVCHLELDKENKELIAPLPGMYGPIHISGNSIAGIAFLIFDKDLMEFIEVRSFLSQPDQIKVMSLISGGEDHLKETPFKPLYLYHLTKLLIQLSLYFPVVRKEDYETKTTF